AFASLARIGLIVGSRFGFLGLVTSGSLVTHRLSIVALALFRLRLRFGLGRLLALVRVVAAGGEIGVGRRHLVAQRNVLLGLVRDAGRAGFLVRLLGHRMLSVMVSTLSISSGRTPLPARTCSIASFTSRAISFRSIGGRSGLTNGAISLPATSKPWARSSRS